MAFKNEDGTELNPQAVTPPADVVARLVEWRRRYATDPALFVEEVLGVVPNPETGEGGITPYQRAILKAAGRGDRQIAIRSGHGVGKTATLAWLVVWQLCIKFPQKTICTASNGSQLFDALAAEIKTWFKKLPPFMQQHMIDINVEHIFFKPAPTESFISFRVSKAETPEALAGAHSDNILLIADEASGIADAIFDSATGSMSGAKATMLLAGNPLHNTGYFYDAFNVLQDDWTLFHVSCEDSPLVDKEHIKKLLARYGGRDTNGYRTRVLGEFPLTEEDTFIPLSTTLASLTRDIAPTNVLPIWGVDVARYGRDASALSKRKGNVLLEPTKTYKDLDTMQLVGRIHDEWNRTFPSERPSAICVDVIGLGAGVVDRLQELGLPVWGINVSESPSMKERHANLKAELWDKTKAWFAALDSKMHGVLDDGSTWRDEALARELAMVRYKIGSNGKIAIESKDEIRKRLDKRKSPDRADSFVLTFAAEAVSATYGSVNAMKWKEALPSRGVAIC